MQTMSGTVISLLPIGLGMIVFVINPNYMNTMLTNSCGILMLVVGAVMIFVGYMIIRRITHIVV
jgi:tight adherence protein B